MANKEIPDNFSSIIFDFTKDLSVTFPEFTYLWSKWVNAEMPEEQLQELYSYCLTIYPERFFDILYQNNDMFKPESEINTSFLPNVEFKLLFNCEGVSENTKKTMWRYLQLVLFTVIGGIKDKSTFGETMNLFDGVDENELHSKLKETMDGLGDFFKNMEENMKGEAGESGESGEKGKTSEKREPPNFDKMFENMPNAEEFKKVFEKMPGFSGGKNMPNLDNMQDHLKSLFNGKIGKLAKDMAEEMTNDFSDILGEDMKSTDDVMKNLMKDPKKIMNIMKTVSSKLDNKMKSGEISKDEIMKEASDLMGKMKDMGGLDQFSDLFKNLTKNMGGLGKNMRVDTNAMERMSKQQQMRERLKKKVEAKQLEKLQNELRAAEQLKTTFSLQSTEQPNNFKFSLPNQGTQEKSFVNPDAFIHPDILAEMNAPPKITTEAPKKKNKKKGKK
jgi:hypothetical protein